MAQSSVFQRLYDSEINFRVSCFWDNRFDVALGDEMNGFGAKANLETWGEVEQWFEENARRLYPNSKFAMGDRFVAQYVEATGPR
jgi:hypothetical protein